MKFSHQQIFYLPLFLFFFDKGKKENISTFTILVFDKNRPPKFCNTYFHRMI